jgi:hypothetical protein
MNIYIKLLTAIVLVGIGALAAHHFTAVAYEGEMTAHLLADSRAQAQAEKAARDAEHKLADANAAAGEQYEKGKRDAEAAGKRVADELRAGNIKLRKRWQGCVVPGAAPGSGEPDAEAADRAESAGRIIRAAHEADEQIKGLQDILRAERK